MDKLLKGLIRKVLDARYHYKSNKIAYGILRNVEEEKGEKLSSDLKFKAATYAKDVLGWKGFAPWLYVYTALSGEFKEGWLPDNYYGKMVIPKIQGDYGRVSFLKPLTNSLFKKEICPDIAYFINGKWFDKDFVYIASADILDVVFKNTDEAVCKLDQSYQGLGVFKLNKNSFKSSELEKRGNFVLQEYIQQHQFFNDFLSNAVATLRMTTVVTSNGNISLRASYLRLGRLKDTHVKSENHIRIPVDKINGELAKQGYLSNWKTIYEHPDTKISFENKVIPNYDKCVDLVLELHRKMPLVLSIGWDLIVDTNGEPVIMEWNGYSNDIKFSEATQGPCFKDCNWHHYK